MLSPDEPAGVNKTRQCNGDLTIRHVVLALSICLTIVLNINRMVYKRRQS
jgi:hypothetical protein